MAADARTNELNQILAEMRGQHKDEFIRKWGPPRQCAALSTGELCEWFSDLGVRGRAYSTPIQNTYTGQVYAVSTTHRSHQRYELMRVEFDTTGHEVTGSAQVRY